MTPAQFWYDGLGRYLHPGPDDPAAGPLLALTRAHEHLTPGKASMRLSKGAMALVTEAGATLKANIKASRPLPPTVVLRDGSWRTSPNWLAEIIMSPPEGRFLIAEFGQQPYVLHTFQFSTADMIHVGGAAPYTFMREPVVRGVEALQGFSPDARFKARCYYESRLQSRDQTERRDEAWAAYAAKFPGLEDAFSQAPPIGSVEFDMVRMVLAVREKAEETNSLGEAA